MSKIKARLQAHHRVYIHNDLANAAHYFKSRIEQREANNDRKGINLEIMAGLTMLAFAIEAKFNFLGDYLLKDKWKEMAPALQKVEMVCTHLGFKSDFTIRPYLSVYELKKFRDTLAHGKPFELPVDEITVGTPEELDKFDFPKSDWEDFVNSDFLIRAFNDMNEIWNDLLDRSKLEIYHTLTHSESSLQFVERVVE